MKYYRTQVSFFVQGVLILEQFIWGFPKLISTILGIVNELQTLSYLYKYGDDNSNILTFEIDVITQITRPFNLIPNNQYMSYINFSFSIMFVLLCLFFLKIIKDRQEDIFNGLQLAYNNSLVIKFLLIFINITINFIVQGFGVFVIEFDLITILENQGNYLIIVTNTLSILIYSYLVYLFLEMFIYNWALDFSKEHMVINESLLIQFRMICKFMQILVSVFFKQGQSYQLLQLTLIVASSSVQILLIQKFKVYLYGKFYFAILALNCFEIIVAIQYFLIIMFKSANFQYLWIVLALMPFQYYKYTTERDSQQSFLDIKNSSIEVCNFILFAIIKSQQQNTNVFFQQQLLYLMYLENHKKKCIDLACICHENYSKQKTFNQAVHNLFFTDLQKVYEHQINNMSFLCSQDQIIFGYLQLLFFRKKHLTVFQLIQVVFTKLRNYQSHNNSEKRNQKEYFINKNAFRVKSLNRVIILKVAQSLVKVDIQQLLFGQKQASKPSAQQIHQKITEMVEYQHISIVIKRKLLKIIQLKMNFLDKINSSIDSSKLSELAFKSIRAIHEGQQYLYLLRKIQDKKISKILMFFQVEILQDIVGASSLISSNETIQQKHYELLQEFQREFSSMIVNISDCEHVEILNYTFNNSDQLGKLQFNTFENLIPEFILKYHSKLIEGFISGEQNKYYLSTNNSFITTNSILVNRIDLVMDVTSISMSKLETTLLMSKKEQNSFSIFCDDKMGIQNIEEQLFCEIFGIEFQFASKFIGLHISNLLPDFKKQNLLNYTSNILYFIDFTRAYENFTQLTRYSSNQSIFDIQDLSKYWKNSAYLIQYSCDVRVFQHSPQKIFQYYEISITNPKRLSKNHEIVIYQTTMIQKDSLLFNESISIDLPQDNDYIEALDTYQQPHQLLKSDRDVTIQDKLLSPISPKKSKESDQNSSQQQIDIEKGQVEKANETSSQATSVSELKKSQFFQQFTFVNKILTVLKPPANLIKIQIAILLFLITLIFGVCFILDEIDQFHYFAYDFQLLGIKKDVFYPILAFQLVRYTILNYKTELALSIINQSTYDDYVQYAQSHLYSSYDQLKANINKIVNQESFASLYSVQYLDMLFLKYDDEGEDRQLNLRTTLLTLLNYQYEIQNAYIINGKADYKSPYFYYSNKNYDDLLRTFSAANLLVLYQSQNRSQNSYKIIFSIIITTSFILVALQLLMTFYSFQLQKLINQFTSLILNQDQAFINLEIQRMKVLTEMIENQFEKIENYSINIIEREQTYKKIEKSSKQQRNKQESPKKIKIQYRQLILKNVNCIIIIMVFIIIAVYINNYYFQLQNTASFYKTLSDINIDILILYSSREVLYHKSIYPFLNATDFDYYRIIAENSLIEIEQHVDILSSNLNQDYVMNNNFQSLINDFNAGNLCIQLIEIDSTNEICDKVFNGILKQGFQASLVYLKNAISVEMEQTNFTNRISYPTRELEGVVMLSQSLKNLIENYYSFLCSYNTDMEIMLNIISVSCLVFSLTFGVYLLIYIKKVEKQHYQSAIKFIYLIPLSTILYDENFIRNTKSMLITNDLM